MVETVPICIIYVQVVPLSSGCLVPLENSSLVFYMSQLFKKMRNLECFPIKFPGFKCCCNVSWRTLSELYTGCWLLFPPLEFSDNKLLNALEDEDS